MVPGAISTIARQRLGAERRVDDISPRTSAARNHVSLHAGRATGAGVPAHPVTRREHSLESRSRTSAADLCDQHVRRARSITPSTSGAPDQRVSSSIASPASARAAASTGSTTADGRRGGAITIDAPATDPRATIWAAFKHDVARVLLLVRRALAPQFAETGRAQPECLGRQHHLRQSQAAEPVARRCGIHPWRRGARSIRERSGCTPKRIAASPGPVADDSTRKLPPGTAGPPILDAGAEARSRCGRDEALQAIVPRVFSDAGERVSFPETGDPYRGRPAETGARHRGSRDRARRVRPTPL